MPNQTLLNYIQNQMELGFTQDEIKKHLVSSGYNESEAQDALKVAFSEKRENGQVLGSSQKRSSTNFPGAIDTLKEAWSIYKSRVKTFLGVMVFPMLLVAAMAVVLASGGIFSFAVISKDFMLGKTIILILLGLVFILSMIIIHAWGQIALIQAVSESGQGIGVREAYRKSKNKIASYFWISLITGFITLGGFLLFIIPGFIFSIWFSMSLFVLVAEDQRGMDALLKSKYYIKGHAWAVLWRFFVVGLVSVLFSIIPSMIFDSINLQYVDGIVNFIFGLFFTPFLVTYTFVMYKNLKRIKSSSTFTSTRKSKITLILVAILGYTVLPVLFLTLIRNLGNNAMTNENSQTNVNLVTNNAAQGYDIQAVKMAIDEYYATNGTYPSSLVELVPVYFDTLPVDPITGLAYEYRVSDDEGYTLCVTESESTPVCITP